MNATPAASSVGPVGPGSPTVARGSYGLETAVLLLVLAALAAAAWIFTAISGTSMTSGMMVAGVASGDLGMLSFFLLTWGTMMVAMMFPAAAPMVRAFVRLSIDAGNRAGALAARATAFVGSYIAVWGATGFVAAGAYLLIGRWSSDLAINGTFPPLVVGAVLVAAGLYQATPLKETCLAGCQSPASFLLVRWRSDVRGALSLGLRHAAYCVGCCWLLFAVLFVAGVMAIGLMAILAAAILLERLFAGRTGRFVSLGIGGAIAAAGVAISVVPGLTA